MFNYNRLTFIFILLSLILIVTDSSLERQARKSLLSLVNIVVEESNTVGETAPSSFLDTLETSRIGLYNIFDKQEDNIGNRMDLSSGLVTFLLGIVYYLILILKFICNYVITFYPFVILLLYLFLTSPVFKKNEFENF